MKLLATFLLLSWLLFCIFAPTYIFNLITTMIAGYSIGHFACKLWIESNDYTRN